MEIVSPSTKNQSTETAAETAAETPRASNKSNSEDDLVSVWITKTSKTGGLPQITYEQRKPDPLGTMFHNCAEEW